MPRRVLHRALSGVAGRHWIVALAAAKCFTTGLLLVGLPVKLDRLGWSDTELGALWCVNAASYAVICSLYSLALDRIPLRRMMALSCLVAALASLGLAACRTRLLIFMLGPCWSLGSALFWPSLMAWIGESEDTHLAGDVSAFNAAWTLAMTAGYLLGGQMAAVRDAWCFYLVSAVSLVLLCIIPFAHIRGKQASAGGQASQVGAVALPRRFMAAGWVAAFLVTLCVGVPGAIFIKLNSDLGYGPRDFGIFFGLRGAAQALVVLGLGAFQGWRYRRWPLVACLGLSAAGSLLLARAGLRGPLIAGFMLLGAGAGMGYSMGFYYSIHGRRNRKRNAGLFESVIASQSIVGGPMGGWLASAFGRRVPYAVLACLAAAAAAANGLLLRRARQRLREMQSAEPPGEP